MRLWLKVQYSAGHPQYAWHRRATIDTGAGFARSHHHQRTKTGPQQRCCTARPLPYLPFPVSQCAQQRCCTSPLRNTCCPCADPVLALCGPYADRMLTLCWSYADPLRAAVGGSLGDFDVMRQLGCGAFATVYEAECTITTQDVALKYVPHHNIPHHHTVPARV